MTEIDLFLCIKERLLDTCNWLTDVRMYNQQDIFQESDSGYNTPIVFVDFQDITNETISHKVQEEELTVVIKLVNEQYDDNYLDIYNMKDGINDKLNFWGEWDYNLELESQNIDNNADSLYVYDLLYNTRFKIENFTEDKILIGGTSGTAWDICIDLDIENPFM